MSTPKYSAYGKLLLFGEYLVLRGAQSMALPLHYSQSLMVSSHSGDNLIWDCFEKDEPWLKIELSPTLEILNATDSDKAGIVVKLLSYILRQQPAIEIAGKHFRFDIDFDRKYGLGTSSTFLSLLSQWSGVDPYSLQNQYFKGSGFDIAAATAGAPFIYKIETRNGAKKRIVKPIELPRAITGHLLFVYTGKKQISLSEVRSFDQVKISDEQLRFMNQVVEGAATSDDIEQFEMWMQKSERFLSKILKATPVKERLFPDYPYAIKSLGAWGGDFVMATFRDERKAIEYFHNKKMNPIFNYRQLVKK